MTGLSHTIQLGAITAAVGVMMIKIGFAKGQLQRRAVRRKCPCCGRLLSLRGCDHCDG